MAAHPPPPISTGCAQGFSASGTTGVHEKGRQPLKVPDATSHGNQIDCRRACRTPRPAVGPFALTVRPLLHGLEGRGVIYLEGLGVTSKRESR
jgi:hypothetical protein